MTTMQHTVQDNMLDNLINNVNAQIEQEEVVNEVKSYEISGWNGVAGGKVDEIISNELIQDMVVPEVEAVKNETAENSTGGEDQYGQGRVWSELPREEQMTYHMETRSQSKAKLDGVIDRVLMQARAMTAKWKHRTEDNPLIKHAMLYDWEKWEDTVRNEVDSIIGCMVESRLEEGEDVVDLMVDLNTKRDKMTAEIVKLKCRINCRGGRSRN